MLNIILYRESTTNETKRCQLLFFVENPQPTNQKDAKHYSL